MVSDITGGDWKIANLFLQCRTEMLKAAQAALGKTHLKAAEAAVALTPLKAAPEQNN